jgi:competence protein ComEC
MTKLRILSGVVLCLLVSSGPLSAQTLRIFQIDVEQADAALLVMPNGKTLLIDSGKNGHGPRIQAVMQRAGVTQIDVFVNTHYHEDHFGGIDDLVDAGVPVLESFDRGDKDCCLPQAKKNQTTFKDYQRTVGEDARSLRPGDAITLDPLVLITCISSGGRVVGEVGGSGGAEENDMSVSLLVEFRGFKAFYGGDTEAPTETKIAARDLAMNVDLYKGNHHGSHSSTSPTFMADLMPTLIVISNGNDDNYKHPRQITLTTTAALMPMPTVLQTNKCFRAAPCANVADALIADPETVDQDGTIEIEVDAATESYTARYRTTTRTFMVKSPATSPLVSASTVVIAGVLPNPSGPDDQAETVSIRNRGTTSISLVGWTLKDRSGATWNLSGSLALGQSRTFRRNGQAMSLNNAGDELSLLDADSVERDRFEYAASSEGMIITTGH